MRVVWAPTALRDVQRAFDFVAADNPPVAMDLARALMQAGDRLSELPRRGRPVPDTALGDLVTAHPYIIRYRLTADAVFILRVRHTSRRPTRP